ncbi:hypothetical protein J7438_17780 [Thalassotalea sp. G20_0]|uniref:hypothetical protein n=1 Tax=Thalassotalea sp. G20_0 TaxID=2821093 RepID=UPI001ADC769C|nr:hypothetical protein [Thalassotalea sp. G20_0]MBO9495918.1 hypothetical protein [Thalassotalea sp. G20_0]
MPPILTSCITMTPTSDPAGTDSNPGPEQASGWSRYWNVSKSIAKSIHPGFDPHQGPDQPDTPWIQLNIQPRELAFRLVQKTIPANSYLNTINQLVMACMALASLPGCGGASSEGSNPASTHGSATANTTGKASGSNKPTTRASSPDTSSAPTMAASTAPPGCRGEPIPVDGAAVLAKVGKDSCYPASGNYTQTTDIDAGNHSPIPHFTGEYNGNGNTISNLKGCLFNSLEGNGTVRNLAITNGHIDRAGLPGANDTGSAALVACTMSGGSRQENIVVENSKINVTAEQPDVKQHRQLGMLAGKMNDSAVLKDNQINNVKIAIQGSGIDVGMLAGQALDRATIDSNQVKNCKVDLSGFGSGRLILKRSRAETNINIGLIAGKMVGNEHNNVVVKNSTLIHNRIESSEGIWAANIGGVAGRADFARIEDTQAHNQNKIQYHSKVIDGRIAMVVADARHCTILNTNTSYNHLQLTTAKTYLPAHHVGIVTADCHNSIIKDTLDIDSDLELSSSIRGGSGGHAAVAAAVAEGCSIHNTTAIGTKIAAETYNSSVAIVVAFNNANTTVHRTTAVDCELFAWKKNTNSYTGSAAVGVAAGRQDNFARISDTRDCGSTIKGYRAGIAAVDPDRCLSGTFACNTELTSFADGISTTVNLACDNASCPATDRADIVTVATSDRIPCTIKHLSSTVIPSRQNGPSLSAAAGNGTVNSTASALHNNSEEVDVEFPTALTGGIVAGGMIAGGVTLYALYQWYQGYWQGLKGKALAIYPLTRIKETISQRFSTANPDTGLELSELVGAGDTSLSS